MLAKPSLQNIEFILPQQPVSKRCLVCCLLLIVCMTWVPRLFAQVSLAHGAPTISTHRIPALASESYPGSLSQIGGSRWVTPMLTIKTNVTELATTTLNVGVEQYIGNRFSLSVPISYNPWTFKDNKKIKHLAIQPEFRVWFGETFRGSFINVQSFIGLQLHYLYYNVGGVNLPFRMFPDPKSTRYEGQGAGGGLTYANQFGLGGRWRGEVGTTLVFSYLWYDSYECKTCGAFKGSGTHRYVGPGKSSLSIIYLTAIYALY